MNQQDHLSDEVLAKIVSDDRFDAKEDNVETHIADCAICQTRLMSLAADDSWRDEYRDCLSAEVLTDASLSGDSFLSTNPQFTPNDAKPEIHEYDRASIDQMLAAMLSEPKHPETLGSLNRYEVESVIGAGGMGLVLRGYDHDLQRPVAIKTILPRLSKNGTAKQRFAREARAVAALLHPNVISVHDVDESNGIPWFVMPYIAGPSLREMVASNGPLPEREIVRIGLQIASGLAAAHSQGLVHRDIKPANILIDNRVNRVVITDFGLARRQSDDAITQTGNLAGTLSYMSPEQVRGEDLDGRSDLFSLGCVLYFLSTGEVPFPSGRAFESIQKITGHPHADVRTLNPEISKTLAGAIDKLLEKDADRRFESAAELEKFLEELVSHLNQPTKHDLPKVPRSIKSSSLAMAVSLTTVGVLILGAVAYWFSNPSTTTVTKEQLWGEIQNEYGIDSPDDFRDELSGLKSNLDRLDREFDDFITLENESFIEESDAIGREFLRIEKSIDGMSN
jgi:serine/threonine-protein kinase